MTAAASGQGVVPYLPLSELRRKRPPAHRPAKPSGGTR